MSRAGPALPKDLDRQVASDNSSSLWTMLSRRRLKLGEQGSTRDTGFPAVAGAPLYTSRYEPTTTFPALCAAILGQVVVGEGEVTGHPLPATVRNLVLGRVSTYA